MKTFFTVRLVALVSFAVLLAACGSDGPAEQVKTELPSLSGTATYDETVAATEVSLKGASGTPRTSSNSLGTNQYKVVTEALTAPYMLRWAGGDRNNRSVTLYSLATKSGTANITPLTTLVTAQLLGQEPAAAFAAFGVAGGPRTDLVTDANLSDAQARVVAYLQDVLGVTVKNGVASFVTSPFTTTVGDPMFDTIRALDDRLQADGKTLDSITTQLAAIAALCIREKIVIAVEGRQREFCPATKSANREDDDNTIIDYVFMNLTNDTLTVKVRDDTVLSSSYVTAVGSSYSCEAAACGAIALGVPAADLTRTLTFTNAELAGATSGAVLGGTLVGAVPGVALPILPCDNNRFFVIFEDRTVVGDCVDAFDPLGLGGTINASKGAVPSRAVYAFSNSASSNPGRPAIEVVTDGNEALLSVFYYEVDPDTGFTTLRYVCQAAACNGVTLGEVTTDTELLGPDYPVSTRVVTFDNTVLAGLNEDGSPTNLSATLRASFKTVYFVDPFAGFEFPELVPCAPTSDAIEMTVLSGPFNFCSDPMNRSVTELPDGDLAVGGTDDSTFYPLTLTLHEGVVTRVSYSNGQVNQTFSCAADCSGVTVSAPDEDGNRIVKFDGTVLHEEQTFPLPGPRTLTLKSGELVFPP